MNSERIALGGLIIDNEKMHDANLILTPESFIDPSLGNLYRHLQQFHYDNEPFDAVSISDKLGDNWLVPCMELVSNASRNGHGLHHIKIVKENHVKRLIKEQLSESINKIINRTESSEVLNDLSLFISTLESSNSSSLRNISNSMDSFVDGLEERYNLKGDFKGLSTGLPDLDKSIQGMQDGNLIIIAGRPAMGKSVLAQNIASHNSINEDKTVLFFSLEMTEEEIQQRLVSSVAGTDYAKIQNAKCVDDGQDMDLILDAIGKIKKGKFIIDDPSSMSISEMVSKSISYARKNGGVDLILVDYLQLLSTTAENRFQEVSMISRQLKSLAKQLNCPVIALSQLSRSLESRSDKRPVMSDLRESGQLEQDADKIIFIYRDEVYNEKTQAKDLAELIVSKARNCPKSNVVTRFDGAKQTFRTADHRCYDIIDSIKTKKGEANEFSKMYKK